MTVLLSVTHRSGPTVSREKRVSAQDLRVRYEYPGDPRALGEFSNYEHRFKYMRYLLMSYLFVS